VYISFSIKKKSISPNIDKINDFNFVNLIKIMSFSMFQCSFDYMTIVQITTLDYYVAKYELIRH